MHYVSICIMFQPNTEPDKRLVKRKHVFNSLLAFVRRIFFSEYIHLNVCMCKTHIREFVTKASIKWCVRQQNMFHYFHSAVSNTSMLTGDGGAGVQMTVYTLLHDFSREIVCVPHICDMYFTMRTSQMFASK